MSKKINNGLIWLFIITVLAGIIYGNAKSILKNDFWKLNISNILEISVTLYVGSVVAGSLAHINAAYSKHVELLCQVFEHLELLAQSFVSRTEYAQSTLLQTNSHTNAYRFWLIAQKDFSRYLTTLKNIVKQYPEIQTNYNDLRSYSEALYELGSIAVDSTEKEDKRELALNQMKTNLELLCDCLLVAKADIFKQDFKR